MDEEVVIKSVLDLSESAQKTQRQIEKALQSAEAKTLAHQRRLETIAAQSSSRLQQIDARRHAQLDAIRERGVQRALEGERKIQRETQRSTNAIDLMRAGVGRLTSAFALLGGAVALQRIAQFGIDLDKSRNAMTALTGSVDAANKKMVELRELAKVSPGVTTTFATQLFNQLKAVGGIGDQVINSVIKSLGKLNTVFSDVGPEFTRNLIQIFQQGFERGDIKEALGRVPIFEQLLEQSFGTKDPAKLRKLKDAGKITLGGFLSGFAEGINTDPRFKNIQESLGGKLAKQFEQTKLKLAELGERLLKDLLPVLEKLIPVANSILDIFTKLPVGLQAATIAFIALPGPIIAVANAIRGLATSVLGLSAAGLSPGLARLAPLFGGAAGGLLAGAAVGLGINEADRRIANLNAQFEANLAKQRGEVTFLDPARQKAAQEQRAALDLALKTGVLSPELKALMGTGATKPSTTPTLDPGKITGGGGGSRTRFVGDGGLGDAELIRHEAELARIRQSNLAVVLRRQQPFGLGALPQLSATGAGLPGGITGFPGQELAALAAQAAEIPLKTAAIMSNSERLMRGFADSVETVGDAFERFGSNVARAFTNVRTLFDGLKRAVLDFFNDLLGTALQNLVKGTLGGLFSGAGGLLGNLFRGGGGGISAPASVSSVASSGIDSFFGASVPRTAGSIGSGGSFFGNLGSSFAGAAPLLGLSFGSSLGGQSTGGQILGAAGGLLAGSAKSLLGLGSIAGIAGLVAAPFALIGSFLLGRSAQRKSDEAASGEMLTQALAGIDQLAAAVASGQITTLAEARSIFDSQILGTFRQQIGTLKTKSVRESRLTNQVRDLQNVFNARIPPLVAEAEQRALAAQQNALTHSRLIPEFATGGTTRGGLAILHSGEKVLNLQQQSAVRAMSRPDIFERAGVPGVRHGVSAFPHGGTYGGSASTPIVIENLTVSLLVGKGDATRIVVEGGTTAQGRAVTVNNVKVARTNREL